MFSVIGVTINGFQLTDISQCNWLRLAQKVHQDIHQ